MVGGGQNVTGVFRHDTNFPRAPLPHQVQRGGGGETVRGE